MLSNGKIRRAPQRCDDRVASNDSSLAAELPELAPLIIDIEASGFGPGSYPIEVGVAMPDGTPHCFLVAPERSWTSWDSAAEAVHGITRDILRRGGQPAPYVAQRLNSLLANNKVYSDAWSFDLSWIGLLFESAGIPQHFRLASIVELLSERQRNIWHETRDKVVRDLALRRHRASGDALILRETLLRVRNPRATVGDRLPLWGSAVIE